MYVTIIISLHLFLAEAIPKSRILEGEDCTEKEFPSFLALSKKGHLPRCGAVLLDSITAVTAAHCVFNVDQYEVTAGTNDIEDDAEIGTTSLIKEVIIHKDFNEETKLSDIAILKLYPPILENEFVKYAELPHREVPLLSTCTAVGYGTTKSDKIEKPYFLQKTQTRTFLMEDDHLIVGIGVKESGTAAFDDSGGPLYCTIDNNNVLSGIIVKGIPETENANYLNVFKYKNWIERRLRKKSPQFHSYLQLVYKDGKKDVPFCNAVLLDSTTALTAAHCFTNFVTIYRAKVFAGSYDIEKFTDKPTVSYIKESTIHKNYNKTTRFSDYAILKLDPPILKNDFIDYAQLPDKEVPMCSTCYMVGYRERKMTNLKTKSYFIHKTPITISSIFENNTLPSTRFSSRKSAKDYLIHGTGEQNENEAIGDDSGGPLYCTFNGKTVLSGLTINGVTLTSPGTYMNVFKYKKWIR